jgi:hypothetical protein
MKNAKNKEQIIDPIMNTIFIFDLQMNNNCRSGGFGMQKFKDDMSGILAKLVVVFTQSSRVFTQSS